ncbi:MAG: ATP-binding protein [Longimicrobiales bacterium]
MIRITGILAVLVAIPYVVPFLTPDAQYAFGALYAPVSFHVLTLSAALLAAHRQRDLRARRFWRLIAAAISCWLIVKTIQIVHGTETGLFELVEDVLFVGFYLFIALALEQEPHHRGRPERLGVIRRIDAVVFAFVLLVYFAVLPAAVNAEAYLTWVPSMLLYAVLDVYVLLRLLVLYREDDASAWRPTYALLMVTAGLWLGTDALEALALMDLVSLAPVGTPIDAVFFLQFFTLIAATRTGAPEPDVGASGSLEATPAEPLGGSLLVYAVVLPVLHVLFYSLGWLDEATRSIRETWVVVSLVIMAGLAIMYQRQLAKENARLWRQTQEMADRLHLSEQLESIGRLAGGIAHDFNNILTAILGRSGLIRRAVSADNVGAHRHVEELDRAATRGAELVKKLLGFGRRDFVKSVPVDLKAFATTVSSEWSHMLPDGVRLSVVDDATTPTVMLDPSLFEQVMVNLLTNAGDAMPHGGDVQVETKSVSLDDDDGARLGGPPGEYACLSVRDTGVGMDAATSARAFEPFFTLKSMGAGHGMGLSMVYGLVKQHDGLIEIESEPGAGTVVSIFLPLQAAVRQPREQAPAQTATPDLVGTETILLVEDERDVRVMAAELLVSQGYAVLTARDGVEAEALFRRGDREIDLIVSDVVMPRLGGPALHQRLQDTSVPFIFMTGHASDDYLAQGELDPDAPLIRKPWASQNLLMEVRRTLDARKPRSK